MQILIVNFNLDGLSEEEFESSCDELAPAFAAVPGLASKVWLAERAEGIFGGMYTFESKESWEAFRDNLLMPRMQAGIEGGFAGPPEETAVDLYTVLP